jgi:hypothetical protein
MKKLFCVYVLAIMGLWVSASTPKMVYNPHNNRMWSDILGATYPDTVIWNNLSWNQTDNNNLGNIGYAIYYSYFHSTGSVYPDTVIWNNLSWNQTDNQNIGLIWYNIYLQQKKGGGGGGISGSGTSPQMAYFTGASSIGSTSLFSYVSPDLRAASTGLFTGSTGSKSNLNLNYLNSDSNFFIGYSSHGSLGFIGQHGVSQGFKFDDGNSGFIIDSVKNSSTRFENTYFSFNPKTGNIVPGTNDFYQVVTPDGKGFSLVGVSTGHTNVRLLANSDVGSVNLFSSGTQTVLFSASTSTDSYFNAGGMTFTINDNTGFNVNDNGNGGVNFQSANGGITAQTTNSAINFGIGPSTPPFVPGVMQFETSVSGSNPSTIEFNALGASSNLYAYASTLTFGRAASSDQVIQSGTLITFNTEGTWANDMHVQNGNVFYCDANSTNLGAQFSGFLLMSTIPSTANGGIVIKSPNGSCWVLEVSNVGVLSVAAMSSCPTHP